MLEKVPGHYYYVDQFHEKDSNIVNENSQRIKFVCRVGADYPGNQNAFTGTNCQELIRVLIYRIFYLQKQKYCLENILCIFLLRCVLWLFEFRAMRRHNKIRLIPLNNIEKLKTFSDGHVVDK